MYSSLRNVFKEIKFLSSLSKNKRADYIDAFLECGELESGGGEL